MSRFETARPSRTPLVAPAAALACLALLLAPDLARAQRVYVYGPPPPPPPPPPGVYVYSAPQPPRYRYWLVDPPYALALAADLEGAIPVNVPQFLDGNNLQGGAGFKVRIGERIRLAPGLHVTPEVGYGFDHLFASDDIGDAFSWDMNRVFAGARLSFGRILVPVLYAHVGYGWRNTGDPTVPQASGVAFDAGGALDLFVVPHFVFGAHLEYASIDAQPYTPQWVAIGAHAEVLLF
jgi:hypothetical protein